MRIQPRGLLSRTVLLAVVLPLSMTGGVLAFAYLQRDRLPDWQSESVTANEIALNGTPGGLLVWGATSVAFVAVIGLIAIVQHRQALARRSMVAAVNGYVVMMAVPELTWVLGNLDLRTPVGEPGTISGGAVASSIGVAALTWWLAGSDPRQPASVPVDPTAARFADEDEDERRIAWYARVFPSAGAIAWDVATLVWLSALVLLLWRNQLGWWGLVLPLTWTLLLVHVSGGRTNTLTIPRPDEAARALNTLADRTRSVTP